MGNVRQVWVTICEIEPGLFQAIYSNTGSPSKEEALPSYFAGAGTDDAKRWFERSARALGFGEVIWIDVSAADLIRAHALDTVTDTMKNRRLPSLIL